jgi:outer membrane receptor protein involved in Fe transport
MKKSFLITMLICLIGQVIFSQTPNATITGKITNDKYEPVPFATIKVKNGKEATKTDDLGKFTIKVASLPAVLLITSASYDDKEVPVTNADELNVILSTNEKTLEEVTVNAAGDARLRVKQMDVPFAYEIQTKRDFNNSPADPYGSLLTKKGLDVTVSSITFKTYLTRGFNNSGSSRVNQLMDGMDNQLPGLNFFLGSFVGLSDLDIESIEILPGASSALYGPGGMNGTIILNSKNPFKTPGFSLIAKNGLTDIGKNQRDKVGGYYDYTLRWAKNFNNRLAFKINAQFLQANDWLANDTTNYLRIGGNGKVIAGSRQTDPNYDGVNIYGDETKVGGQNIKEIFKGGAGLIMFQNPSSAPALLQLLGTDTLNLSSVSRTGYNEKDVIDPKTKNIKLSGALHYKFNGNIEAILAGHWAKGNTVYTGNNRYAL